MSHPSETHTARPSRVWPTVAGVAFAAALTALPAGGEDRLRAVLLDAAGAALALLPPAPDLPPRGAGRREEARFAALAVENARLRELAEAGGPTDPPVVHAERFPVRLLGRRAVPGVAAALLLAADGATAADGTLLDDSELPALEAGSRRRVSPGDFVTDGDAVLGRVAQVGTHVATVRPVTHADFRTEVRLVRTVGGTRRLGPHGVLAGTGGAGAELRFLSANESVAAGDLVAAAEWPAHFGPSPPLGEVTAATREPGSAYWTVRVRPLTSADAVRGTVAVVRLGAGRSEAGRSGADGTPLARVAPRRRGEPRRVPGDRG